MIGRLAWKPFDVEFEDVKSRLDRHCRLFEFEATSATNLEALKFFKEFDCDLEKFSYTQGLQLREGEVEFQQHEEKVQENVLSEHIPPHHLVCF